jgi:tryptophan synthase alpha chain
MTLSFTMNKLDNKLQELKQNKKLGLMTHVVVGYPSLPETISLVKIMAESGVDIVELQIPFSDPLADGPTIMKACEEALANGTKVKDAFKVMKSLSSQVEIPLLFMTYYNTIFNYGVEKFCFDAQMARVAGLIVPDMPLDEEANEHFFEYCRKYNLYHIQVISPASTDERLKKNAAVANGFVYVTSRQGTTGAKDSLDPKLSQYLTKVRKYISQPLAVGFGISKREHLQMLKGHADIAVIGSAIIDVVKSTKKEKREEVVKQFLKQLKS